MILSIFILSVSGSIVVFVNVSDTLLLKHFLKFALEKHHIKSVFF